MCWASVVYGAGHPASPLKLLNPATTSVSNCWCLQLDIFMELRVVTVIDDAQARAEDESPQQLDWEQLRKLSLRPGGFREQRIKLWYACHEMYRFVFWCILNVEYLGRNCCTLSKFKTFRSWTNYGLLWSMKRAHPPHR